MAGVLAEAEFSGGSLAAVVVGIGINVAWPGPEGAGGTCLDEAGGPAVPVDRRILLDRLLHALAPRIDLLDEAAGRFALAEEVRRRCATLGQAVRVVLADEEFTGRADAIDDAGHLVVETASGTRRVTAGDVVHLRPTEADRGVIRGLG